MLSARAHISVYMLVLASNNTALTLEEAAKCCIKVFQHSERLHQHQQQRMYQSITQQQMSLGHNEGWLAHCAAGVSMRYRTVESDMEFCPTQPLMAVRPS